MENLQKILIKIIADIQFLIIFKVIGQLISGFNFFIRSILTVWKY